jgi:tRNA (Thr-GGU) A37 N-methylase
MKIELAPIGRVIAARAEPVDDDWDSVETAIELDEEQFTADALLGLDAFSHLEVIYHFHAALPEAETRGARRPRGRADWPLVGIFAQRGKDRPNHLGLTICRILRIEGLRIVVQGLDAIDGTPVLDLKPVMSEFLPRGEVRQPGWSSELMRGYWRGETEG